MAFNNEFPHVEANKLNLNWLLKQYATFNDRLQELHDHFDESVETMQNSQAAFEQAITNLFNTFKNETNAKVDEIADAVDQINQQTDEYVYNYLSENITEILETNPVLETKYNRVGTIAANSSITIELEQNKIYDIMCLNYAFDMVKVLASNNTAKIVQAPILKTSVVEGVIASETSVPDVGTVIASVTPLFTDPVILYYDSYITISVANNVLTLTNTSGNVITVYDKIIFG